jgi:hypothetical protein
MLPSAERYFIFFRCWTFALCERKNPAQEEEMYHAAVRPEPVEGQAKNADCVNPIKQQTQASVSESPAALFESVV